MFDAMDEATHGTVCGYLTDFERLPDVDKREISSFNWLWPIFEDKHCNTNADQTSLVAFINRTQVDQLIGSNADVDRAWTHFQDRYHTGAHANQHLTSLINQQGGNFRIKIEAGLHDTANAEQKSTALVLIVYRLRNNLFHGTKGQYGFADQFDNFRNANSLLRAWIATP